LEHSIERACILCGAGFLEEHHFSFLRGMQPHNEDLAKPVPRYSLSAKWEDAEAKRILQVLEACGGNRQKAASILQISRTTLFRKMKKYGLQ
jgi:DNA-binding NtrC family response regulator